MPSSQENASPLYFSAKGLSDSLDATPEFPGAMAGLQNLVFDPSSDDVLQCRPASIELLSNKFPSLILSLGFVSCFRIVGDFLYGLAASDLVPGFDQPFAFNLATGLPFVVTGNTAANVPTSPATSGPWTPPTMDVIGTKVVVTHPGFATAGPFATATDTITFSGNPTDGQTLTFGAQVTNQLGIPGTVVTFTTATPIPADDQVQIGVDLTTTLASLLAFLQGNGDANLGALTYSVAGDVLTVAYRTPGVDGNSYPVSSQFGGAVVATPTLTGGTGLYFGWFDISTPLAPIWNAGNTAINPLPSPPVAVAQFNSRAYYLCNPPNAQPGLLVSDPLQATVSTNGDDVLTFGDNQPLTALAALPLQNQLGGIVQSVIVFKGVTEMVQVTGDPLPNTAAGPWAKNTLNVATGTLAPRSIASTPSGLMFLSPQGYRVISFTAQVSPPIGANGKGVSVPFIQCPVPSRVAAAANASLLRVSLPVDNQLLREFWFDMTRGTWTGPHTFPANAIQTYENTFVLAPIGIPNSIWRSDWFQTPGSTFFEPSGIQLQWSWQTSLLPDVKDMLQHEMHETIVKISTGSGATAQMVDESGNTITDALGNGAAVAAIPIVGATASWGQARWTGSILYGQAFSLSPTQIGWPSPVVFARASLQIAGLSDSLTRIGALSMRYEQTGYLPIPGN